jgi:hypothetical protein
MALALGVSALVAAALVSDMLLPKLGGIWSRYRVRRGQTPDLQLDPGRDRRAEQTARELLRSCVGEAEWAMYKDLGFIRVWGKGVAGQPEQAYLIYPHEPIVAYAVQTGRPLSEHCVTFPDETRPYGSVRLPDADDVLAKWMALTGDEDRLIASANMHLPGRQMSLSRVTHDIWRLARWERARTRATEIDPAAGPTPVRGSAPATDSAAGAQPTSAS